MSRDKLFSLFIGNFTFSAMIMIYADYLRFKYFYYAYIRWNNMNALVLLRQYSLRSKSVKKTSSEI